MIDGAGRPVRAAAFAVATVALASVAHSVAGGHVPPVPAALAAVAVCWLLGVLLARWRWGVLGLTALLGGTQLLLHQVFHLLQAPMAPAPTGPGPTMDHSAMAGMDHSAMAGADLGMPPAQAAPGGLLDGSSLLMLAAHVLAVLATAVVLAAGEAAWAMARRLRRWTGRLFAAAPVPVVVQSWRLVPPARRPRVVRLVGPARRLTRRGPPVRPAPGVLVVVAAVSW